MSPNCYHLRVSWLKLKVSKSSGNRFSTYHVERHHPKKQSRKQSQGCVNHWFRPSTPAGVPQPSKAHVRPEQRKRIKGWDWAVRVRTLAGRDGFEVSQALLKKLRESLGKVSTNLVHQKQRWWPLHANSANVFFGHHHQSQSQLQRRRTEGTLTVDPLHTVNKLSSPALKDLKGICVCLIHFFSKTPPYLNWTQSLQETTGLENTHPTIAAAWVDLGCYSKNTALQKSMLCEAVSNKRFFPFVSSKKLQTKKTCGYSKCMRMEVS